MTIEEKIKKARDIICHNCRWNECGNNSCPTLQETVKAIELGLAEGRKEKEWLENTNNEQTKVILKLQEQIESLTETLKSIATDTKEHITHNVAQNELDKWELTE